MTEQERELLHEFEQLKRISGAQQKAWQSAFENLLNMYEDTKRECARLDDQLQTLNRYTKGLGDQVQDLSAKMSYLNLGRSRLRNSDNTAMKGPRWVDEAGGKRIDDG